MLVYIAFEDIHPSRKAADKATRVVNLDEVPRSAFGNYRFTVKVSKKAFVQSIQKIHEVDLSIYLSLSLLCLSPLYQLFTICLRLNFRVSTLSGRPRKERHLLLATVPLKLIG